MAPPKVRLHKSSGKLKSIPRPQLNSNGSSQQPTSSTGDASNGSTSDASSDETFRQFELELYWCIEQLEKSLSLQHVRENKKKMEETTKLILNLKSANQPIIRKRQIMRSTFGDYRSKMAAEEQSLAVNPDSVRFQDKQKKVKYHFVKKSSILNGSKDFRFNFPVAGNNGAGDKVEVEDTEKKQTENTPSHSCTYVPSDNSFRFNFAATSEKDA
uniref:Uncharacterized protein n=1 Tax=Anopheles atroparvus TaxID=41427 RepID=A0A240PKM7_ANOAO